MQHDILWESLTARQHMEFYGRLKNLTGKKLRTAVVEGLKQVLPALFAISFACIHKLVCLNATNTGKTGQSNARHRRDGWNFLWWNEKKAKCGNLLDWAAFVLLFGEMITP